MDLCAQCYLSENYFQHADHFTRILNEKEIQKKTFYKDNSSVKSDDLIENKEKKIESTTEKKR